MGAGLRHLTMVLPHFCNLGMWAEHQRVWQDYPDDLRARLHVILVDDCSPKGFRPSPKSITVTGLGSLRIFRILKKKRWNWLACRNLGAQMAGKGWMLLTDIDHVLPVETATRLLMGDLDPTRVYRFKRVAAARPWPYALSECLDTRADGTKEKPHNDSWLVTREMFFSDKVGGYDERLSGCYGTSGEFTDRVLRACSAHVMLTDVLIRYPREIIADASTPPSVYTRKNDPENDAELKRLKAERATIDRWKPLHGLLPWEQVYPAAVEQVA